MTTPRTQSPAHAASLDDAKAKAFSEFLKTQGKSRPGELVLLSDGGARVDIETIPTGAISLDLAIGAGGFPRGRIVELYGPEGSGKSTLALQVAKNAQELGGIIGFVDAEHALNRELCHHIGIDEDRFAISQPDDGEHAINLVADMLDSNVFDVIIVDSVAAMVPKAELDAEAEQQFMGLHARLMSKFMRQVAGKVSESNTMLILINQVRANLGAYGAPDTTTGGRAIKFYSSLRIEVRTSASKKIERGTGSNKEVIGVTVTATVKKNKLGPPFRVAEYDVIFGHGVEGSGSLLDVCEKLGLVVRSAASYTDVTTGERIGIGKENVKDVLASEEGADLRDRLTEAVYQKIRGATHVETPDDPSLELAVVAEAAELSAQPEDQPATASVK